MQKRLDVIAALTEEEIGQYRDAAEMHLGELTESIEGKLRSIRERMQIHPGEYLESARNEAADIRDRFMNMRYHAFELKTVKDHWKRGMILGNPGMQGTGKVRYSLEELKEAVKERLNFSMTNDGK